MFVNRLTLFTLLGFRIRVDASWLLLAVLIVWSLAAGLFPTLMPGREPVLYWSLGIVGLFGLAASIIAHELAHAVVARRYEIPIEGITLFVFGGVAEMEHEPSTARSEFLMAIAGPVMSLAVAVIFWTLAALFQPGGSGPLSGEQPSPDQMAIAPLGMVFGYVAFLNLLLALFNMAPAFPLDGGRVLRSVLWGWTGDYRWATRVAATAGSVLAALLMALGLVTFISGNVIGGVWYFILGLFVHAAAQAQIIQQRDQSFPPGSAVSRFMSDDVISVAPGMSVAEVTENLSSSHPFKTYPVLDGEGRLVGVLETSRLRTVAEPRATMVGAIMDAVSDESLVGPDDDAGTAFRRMQQAGASRLFVVVPPESPGELPGGHPERHPEKHPDGPRSADGAPVLVGILSLRDLIGGLSFQSP